MFLQRGEVFFARHGPKAVFLARWLPGLRVVGSWLAGVVGQHYAQGKTHSWQEIWLIPAAMSAVLVVVFAFLFHEQHEPVEAGL